MYKRQKQYQAGYQTYLDYVEKVGQYDTSIQTVEAALSQFGGYEQAKNIPSDSPYYQQVQTLIVSYDQLKQNESQITTLKTQLPVIKQELDQNKTVLDQTNAQLVQSKQQLDASNQKIKASKALLDQTGIKLADSKKQLDEAKNTLDSDLPQLEEAKVKLDQAQSDLNEAKQQVADLQKGKIITLTKNESAAILSYSGNCDSISALSILFPVLFFLVAALVSMTTMTRMVEELRVQNGTLRALGYKKKDVIMPVSYTHLDVYKRQLLLFSLMTVAVTGMLAVLAANQNSPREFTTGVIGYIVVVVLLVVSIIYKLSMEALTRKTLFVNLWKIGYTRKELRKIVRQEVISYYFVLILIPLVYIMFISGRFIYYGDMSLQFAYIYILSYIIPIIVSGFITYVQYINACLLYTSETINQ